MRLERAAWGSLADAIPFGDAGLSRPGSGLVGGGGGVDLVVDLMTDFEPMPAFAGIARRGFRRYA